MKAVVLEGNAVNTGDISWDPITRLCDTTIFGAPPKPTSAST